MIDRASKLGQAKSHPSCTILQSRIVSVLFAPKVRSGSAHNLCLLALRGRISHGLKAAINSCGRGC